MVVPLDCEAEFDGLLLVQDRCASEPFTATSGTRAIMLGENAGTGVRLSSWAGGAAVTWRSLRAGFKVGIRESCADWLEPKRKV
jgi:hypothetical protein